MKKRKSLNLDIDIEAQRKAFLFLENIRYNQSVFITKLINDFCEFHGLSYDSPYDEIRRSIKNYISGKEVTSSQNNTSVSALSKNDLDSIIQEVKRQIVNDINTQTGKGVHNEHQNEEAQSSEIEQDLSSISDDSISDMLDGFANML